MNADPHQQQINRVLLEDFERRQREAAIKSSDQKIEATIKIITASYDKASAYTNLMIVAGYAGAFALWNNVKPILSHKSTACVGLLLTVSLIAFVTWEIAGMVIGTKSLSAFNNALQGPFTEFDQAIRAAQSAADRRSLNHRRFWPFALWASILPGGLAGIILFYNFIVQLIHRT